MHELRSETPTHPCAGFEALPDDPDTPTEVTIRPRYANASTTTWVSAAVDDVVTLAANR